MQMITIHAFSRREKKTNWMKIVEKNKNEEKLSHTLPASTKCGLQSSMTNIMRVLGLKANSRKSFTQY